MISVNFEENKFITASSDGSIKLWNFNTFTSQEIIASDQKCVNLVKFSRDSDKFVSVSFDNKICQWDAETYKKHNVIQTNNQDITFMCFNEYSPYMLIGFENGKIQIYEPDKLILVSELGAH